MEKTKRWVIMYVDFENPEETGPCADGNFFLSEDQALYERDQWEATAENNPEDSYYVVIDMDLTEEEVKDIWQHYDY